MIHHSSESRSICRRQSASSSAMACWVASSGFGCQRARRGPETVAAGVLVIAAVLRWLSAARRCRQGRTTPGRPDSVNIGGKARKPGGGTSVRPVPDSKPSSRTARRTPTPPIGTVTIYSPSSNSPDHDPPDQPSRRRRRNGSNSGRQASLPGRNNTGTYRIYANGTGVRARARRAHDPSDFYLFRRPFR